ncbi:MarR family transcriptional regulator [bacterium]|nr:MarR family transcriptional regulator [bacterium]
MKETDITQTLMFSLDQASRVARVSGMRFFEKCSDLDITFNEYFLINMLHAHPNIHQRSIAKLMLKGTANLSRDLEKLEKRGLLKRNLTTKDKWMVKTLMLTEKGEEIRQKAMELAQDRINKIQQIYSPEEYAQFKEFLARFTNEIIKKEDMFFE